MRKASYHHKLIVDDTDTRYAAYGFGRVFVLSYFYLLRRYTVLYHEAGFGRRYHAEFGISAHLPYDDDFIEGLIVGFESDVENEWRAFENFQVRERFALIRNVVDDKGIRTYFQIFQFETSCFVGKSGSGRSYDRYSGSGQRFTGRVVFYSTFYHGAPGCGRHGEKKADDSDNFCKAFHLIPIIFRQQKSLFLITG